MLQPLQQSAPLHQACIALAAGAASRPGAIRSPRTTFSSERPQFKSIVVVVGVLAHGEVGRWCDEGGEGVNDRRCNAHEYGGELPVACRLVQVDRGS